MYIFNMPIEKLDMRYTKQWYQYFEDEFIDQNISFTTIYPPSAYKEIQRGEFLDIIGTNCFKARQLRILLEVLEGHLDEESLANDGSEWFFFHDLWFPGLEMLFYVRDALDLNIKIGGILHAGTYDPSDFISKKGMGKWGHNLELSWLEGVDAIFVGTEYHKSLLVRNRGPLAEQKVHVTYFPIYEPDTLVDFYKKEDICVFPHRIADDKNPDLFHKLARVMAEKYPNWKFIATQEQNLDKEGYYDLLARSKIAISFASHENWGIGMQEACLFGNICIVPDGLSYPEIFNPIFRYRSRKGAFGMFSNFADDPNDVILTSYANGDRNLIIQRGSEAIGNMLKIMGSLSG